MRWMIVIGSLGLGALGCATAGAGREAPAAPESVMMIDGIAGKLRVVDSGGGGVPVVLVHGLGCDLECWRPQIDHLKASRRVIAFDQRGHGGSEPPRDGVYAIGPMADDVDAVVTARGVSRFVLVGHSFAGTVLSAYAGKHPEKLAGLVYVDAVGSLAGLPPEQLTSFTAAPPGFDEKQLHAFYDEILGPDAKPRTREQIHASVAKLSPAAFLQLRKAIAGYSPVQDVARYDGPRFAIEAAGNELPIVASKAIPKIQTSTVPHVSHWLMLDDPEDFNRALDAVLPR
jgi:pimeloyl-ACP methyl ester carboxylesterase